jgi:cysteine desulfurase / selenocysteine lyase
VPPVTDITFMDYAATSAVRPPAVTRAVALYMEEIGATPGRGGHRLANEAGRVALRCRQRVARLLGIAGDVGRIAFTANATHALNAALWGTVRRGERIVVTAFDHNAVLRPAARLAAERAAQVVLVPGASDGSLDDDVLDRALDGARVLVINAASNVLGTTLDVTSLAARARDAGVLSIVDLAQLAGHAPFDAAAAGVDVVAFTGHKGLLGPQGIGGIWVRDGVELDPLLAGGTGGDSLLRTMPDPMPDHLEAGSLNGPGIAGLLAGIEAVLEEDVAALHARLARLKLLLHEGLAAIHGVRVLSPPAPGGVPIVTVVSDVVEPAVMAARLDREHGVLTRAGLHCAPEVHRLLGTAQTGAVRFSLGWATTTDDVQRSIAAAAAVVATPAMTRP